MNKVLLGLVVLGALLGAAGAAAAHWVIGVDANGDGFCDVTVYNGPALLPPPAPQELELCRA